MCLGVEKTTLVVASYSHVYEKYLFAAHSREEKLHLPLISYSQERHLSLPKTQSYIFACDSGKQAWSPTPKMTAFFFLFSFFLFCEAHQ